MPEAQTKAAAKLTAICPQFIVPDVVATAEYYRDVLASITAASSIFSSLCASSASPALSLSRLC